MRKHRQSAPQFPVVLRYSSILQKQFSGIGPCFASVPVSTPISKYLLFTKRGFNPSYLFSLSVFEHVSSNRARTDKNQCFPFARPSSATEVPTYLSQAPRWQHFQQVTSNTQSRYRRCSILPKQVWDRFNRWACQFCVTSEWHINYCV